MVQALCRLCFEEKIIMYKIFHLVSLL